jgi:hypothetical protein
VFKIDVLKAIRGINREENDRENYNRKNSVITAAKYQKKCMKPTRMSLAKNINSYKILVGKSGAKKRLIGLRVK